MSIKIDPLIGSVQVLHNEIETVFTQTPIATQALKNIEMLLANTFSMIGITAVSYTHLTLPTILLV